MFINVFILMSLMVGESHLTSEHRHKSRRTFLRNVGGAGVAASVPAVAGCTGTGESGAEGLADVEPADKINWISQKYASSIAIRDLLPEFEDETGITVETTFLPYTNYTERIGNDLSSQSGRFDCFHSDPYAVSSTYYPEMVDLMALEEVDGIKDVPKGFEDFQFVHRAGASIFGDERVVTLPFDCPTMMLTYRTDIFEQYRDQAESDLGFPFEPGAERSWDEYKQMAAWMNENVDEVEAGVGHQAKQHDALQNDFHLYYWSQGGTSFASWEADGTTYEGYKGTVEHLLNLAPRDEIEPNYSAEKNVEIAKSYKEIIDVAHPASPSWDWNDLNSAFANGKIAMMPQWNVFNPGLADPAASAVRGNVGWALTPTGAERSVNTWGGSGLGINGHVSDERKLAAWKFITWATSPEIQRRAVLKGGGSPTRASVYEMDEIKTERQKPTAESKTPTIVPPVLEAWKEELSGHRPHLAGWNQLNQQVFTQVSQAITGEKSVEEAMADLDRDWSETLGG